MVLKSTYKDRNGKLIFAHYLSRVTGLVILYTSGTSKILGGRVFARLDPGLGGGRLGFEGGWGVGGGV